MSLLKSVRRCSALLQQHSYGLLPGYCVLCRRLSGRSMDLCATCEAALPLNTTACLRCAIPMVKTNAVICGQCQTKPPAFSQCIAPLRYEFPIDKMVNGFKHHRRFCHGAILAELLGRQLIAREKLPDLIVPTPLHWRRQFSRGFNQAQWLARYLSTQLSTPLADKLISRKKFTPSQQGLTRKQRLMNLKHAFALRSGSQRHKLQGKRVALVDDVVTTGSTTAEISRLLLKAGAKEVEIWCLARTPLEK